MFLGTWPWGKHDFLVIENSVLYIFGTCLLNFTPHHILCATCFYFKYWSRFKFSHFPLLCALLLIKTVSHYMSFHGWLKSSVGVMCSVSIKISVVRNWHWINVYLVQSDSFWPDSSINLLLPLGLVVWCVTSCLYYVYRTFDHWHLVNYVFCMLFWCT